MKAVVFYTRESSRGSSDGAGGASAAETWAVSTKSVLTALVAGGSCGLCAYVDEPQTPIQQFFMGLRDIDRKERDTTSQVMRLGRAASGWVVGGDMLELVRDVGIRVDNGLHDVYYEEVEEDVGRRVSSLLAGPSEDCLPSEKSGHKGQHDIVYVLLSGSMANESALERILSRIDQRRMDEAFFTLVMERPGHDIMQIVNGKGGEPRSFRPPQSFTFRASTSVPIRDNLVSIVVYRGPKSPPALSNGRTRVDGVQRLDDVDVVYAEGCGKCVLAERVLFEVAYKIGWSEKYGS